MDNNIDDHYRWLHEQCQAYENLASASEHQSPPLPSGQDSEYDSLLSKLSGLTVVPPPPPPPQDFGRAPSENALASSDHDSGALKKSFPQTSPRKSPGVGRARRSSTGARLLPAHSALGRGRPSFFGALSSFAFNLPKHKKDITANQMEVLQRTSSTFPHHARLRELNVHLEQPVNHRESAKVPSLNPLAKGCMKPTGIIHPQPAGQFVNGYVKQTRFAEPEPEPEPAPPSHEAEPCKDKPSSRINQLDSQDIEREDIKAALPNEMPPPRQQAEPKHPKMTEETARLGSRLSNPSFASTDTAVAPYPICGPRTSRANDNSSESLTAVGDPDLLTASNLARHASGFPRTPRRNTSDSCSFRSDVAELAPDSPDSHGPCSSTSTTRATKASSAAGAGGCECGGMRTASLRRARAQISSETAYKQALRTRQAFAEWKRCREEELYVWRPASPPLDIWSPDEPLIGSDEPGWRPRRGDR